MTTQHDPGPRLSEHLSREARGRAPDWLLESTLAIIETTPQRRALPHLPWRFPNVNTFAKLAIAAVVVIVGAVAVTTFSGAGLNVVGGPGSTASPPQLLSPSPSPSPSSAVSPSPSPSSAVSPSPSPASSPSSAATTIGSLTLTTTGCEWRADMSPLPAGSIRIDASNTTPDVGAFVLLVVDPGHTYQELATIIDGYNSQAQQYHAVTVHPDMATAHGLIGAMASGDTGHLDADPAITSGSVAGIACWYGAPPAVYGVYLAGPLEFK